MCRALAVVALATLLGLAFNAGNPLSVRWQEAKTAAPPASATGAPAAASAAPGSAESARAAEGSAATSPGATPSAPLASAPPATAVSDAETAATVEGPVFITPTATHWPAVKPLAEAGQVVLVDARSQGAFEAGHIPGAISLPQSSSDEALAEFSRQYPTNTHVVVYCSSTSCSLSFKLAYRLAKDFGFTHVEFMTGGYAEYQRAEGLAQAESDPTSAVSAPATSPTPEPGASPASAAASAPAGGVVSDGSPSPPTAVPAPADPSALASANPMPLSWARTAQWRAELGAVLVDARPASAYAAGHVPGAVSLPKDAPAEAYAAFAEKFSSDRPVVAYGVARGEMSGFLVARKLLREHGFHAARFVSDGYREWLAEQDRLAGGAP